LRLCARLCPDFTIRVTVAQKGTVDNGAVYIRPLEEKGRTLLFLRPRRFGKSLLLSMLENYYDVKKAAEFERLFGHLAIGQNPTPRHNRYLIMRRVSSRRFSR
jgi:hypothetical protein